MIVPLSELYRRSNSHARSCRACDRHRRHRDATYPRETNTLKLLLGYANALLTDVPLASPPELRHLIVSQITDLVALTLGATRDAAHIAEGRGVPAACMRPRPT